MIKASSKHSNFVGLTSKSQVDGKRAIKIKHSKGKIVRRVCRGKGIIMKAVYIREERQCKKIWGKLWKREKYIN